MEEEDVLTPEQQKLENIEWLKQRGYSQEFYDPTPEQKAKKRSSLEAMFSIFPPGLFEPVDIEEILPPQ